MIVCKLRELCRHQDLTKGETLCCYYGECKFKEEVEDALHDVEPDMH